MFACQGPLDSEHQAVVNVLKAGDARYFLL